MSLERLTGILADPSGVDFWSDVLISDAEALLETFDQESWEQLGRQWRGWEPEWKLRLAECLSGVQVSHATALLANLILEEDGRIAQTAAAGLRFQDPLPSGKLVESLVARIQALRKTSDQFDAHSLDLTLASLGAVLTGVH